MRRVWLAVVALALGVAACGASEPSRFDLTTPEAHTGAPPAATPEPTPVPSVTATPEPTPKRKPVTKAERAVIKGWADSLRAGKVTAAARYFAVPSRVSNQQPDWDTLETREDTKRFNRELPCGAKLIETSRITDRFVLAVFTLTQRPGGACVGPGERVAVAFLIRNKHIKSWVSVDPDDVDPAPTPSPAPGVTTADPTATGTPTATPTATVPDEA